MLYFYIEKFKKKSLSHPVDSIYLGVGRNFRYLWRTTNQQAFVSSVVFCFIESCTFTRSKFPMTLTNGNFQGNAVGAFIHSSNNVNACKSLLSKRFHSNQSLLNWNLPIESIIQSNMSRKYVHGALVWTELNNNNNALNYVT